MNAFITRLLLVPADLAQVPLLVTKLTLLLTAAWLLSAALVRSNPRWRVLLWRLTASALVLVGGLALVPPFLRLSILPARFAALSGPATESPLPAAPPNSQMPVAHVFGRQNYADSPVPMTSQRPAHVGVHDESFAAGSPQDDARDAALPAKIIERPASTSSAEEASLARPVDIGRPIAAPPAVANDEQAMPVPGTGRWRWLFAIWSVGAAAAALRVVIGLVRLGKVRRCVSAVPAWAEAEGARVAAALRNVRPFRLCQTDQVASPCLVGILNPMILLPAGQCDPRHSDELPAILAHELAHLKGGDPFWNALLIVHSIVLWFHPLAWRMRLAHADACDAVCDAVASDYIGDAGLYGRTLARLTLRIAGAPAAPGLAMTRASSVERRIEAVRRHVFRSGLSRRRAACAVVVSTATIAALGGLALAPSQAQTPNASPSSAPSARPAAAPATARSAAVPAAPPKPADVPAKAVNAHESRITIHCGSSPTGRPIDGVEFEFNGRIGGKSKRSRVHSDAKGIAVFEWPPNKKVERLMLTARKPKFVPIHYMWDNTQGEPQIPAKLELRFERGHEIGGTARDESGHPIAGVQLQFSMPLTWPRRANWVFRAAQLSTDDQGRWSWSEAPTDCSNVGIQIRHRDYLPTWSQATFSRDSVFILKQGLQVKGHVLGPKGEPVIGAQVALGLDRFGTNEPEARTNSDGHFTLKNCKPGRSIVTVQAIGCSPTFQDVEVGKEAQNLEFRLEPGHTVKIRIVDAHGKPVAKAGVAADTWRGYRSLRLRTDTDANGEVVWNSAPVDTMLCDIFKQGYMSVRHAPVKAADEVQVITLPPELVISGRVTDASTGRPIKRFQIHSGLQFANSDRIYWQRDEGPPYQNGRYRFKMSEPYFGTALEAVAPGYLPARSRTFQATDGAQTYDFTLQPGKGPTGVVVRPDGTPISGVDVALATTDGRVIFSKGRFDQQQNHAEMAKTDARGRFEFLPRDNEQYYVIAVSDLGFGEATAEQIEKGTPVKLRPWGRLKGRALVGHKPDVGREVVYYPQSQARGPIPVFVWDYGYTTQTDQEGRFEFDRVIPGPGSVSRVVVTEFGRSSQHAPGWSVPVEVREGRTTDVTIGGSGRPVIGKVHVKGTLEIPLTWSTNQPVDLIAWDKSRNTQVQPYRRYMGNFLASGAFRVPDVPAGDYKLTMSVNNPPVPNACGAGQAIGKGELEFTIPPVSQSDSETPFNVGEITATLFHTLGAGEWAPDFVAERLDGGAVRISDFHGKLVLVNFWATWCGPCLAEIPHLKAVHDRFGKDLRFAQLSLSCDNALADVQQFVEKQNGLDWFQARVGGMESRVPREYTVRAIPATFLIGPDGRVLAKNLKPQELEPAIAAALRNDKLFAAAATGRPARFPVVRSTYAPEPPRLAAAPSVIALCDTDPTFGKDQPHDDRLRLLTASGSELWSHGRLAVCPTIGGGHAVAVDPARNRIYVGEIVADRITAFNLAGQKLWQIEHIPIGTLAIDPKTGNIWASGGGRIDEGETVVFDPQGREVTTLPYEASDIAYSPHDDAFWLASAQIRKLNRKGDVLFKKPVDGWCCSSVSSNPADGTVWIAERAHPDRPQSKNRLWHLSADGSVRHKIELGDYGILAVAWSPVRGEAWITAYNKGIRRVSADGVPGPPLPLEGKSLSISRTSGEIWLANKDALLRLDPTGKVLAKSPFTKPCLQSWLEAW